MRPAFPSRPRVRDRGDPLEIPEDAVTAGPELNVRLPFTSSNLWILTLFSWTIPVLLFAAGLRLLGLWVAGDVILALVALCLVIMAYTTYMADLSAVLAWPWYVVVLGGGALIAPWLPKAAFSAGLVCFAVVCACILADQMATHYAAWLLAHPRISKKACRRWSEVWRRRFFRPSQFPDHPLGFALVAIVVFASLALSAALAPARFVGLVFVTLLTIGLAAAAVASLLIQRSGVVNPLSIVWGAIDNWMHYNFHGKDAPGCHQSPFGHRRIVRVYLLMVLFAMSLPALASYFPLHMALVPETPWAKVADLGWPWLSDDDAKFRQEVIAANRERIDELAHYRPDQVKEYEERLIDAARSARAFQRLHATPESWLLIAVRGAFTWDLRFVWAMTVGLIPSFVVAPVVFVCVWLIVLSRSVPLFAYRLGVAVQREGSDFDHLVTRIHKSEYRFPDGAWERDHLWLGVDTAYGRPILMHRDVLEGHAHVLGATRSGKTSLCLGPVLAQKIRSLNPKSPDYCKRSSIVILDLKGEPSLFHGVRRECEERGVAFKYFTNRHTCATHAFNPFEQEYLKRVSPELRVSLLARSIGIFYGHDYPEVFWSDVNAQVFRMICFTQSETFAA